MNDSNFIEEIARKWVELGGDSEGVAWSWKRLQEAVINIEYAQQCVQPTPLCGCGSGLPAAINGIYCSACHAETGRG